MSVRILVGDMRARLRELPDNSIDSVCTDPPYHLTSIVKRFGSKNAAPAKAKQSGAYERASRGFMGQQWDGGDVAFDPETWAEVFRVLKPGGHVVAFGGTRTYHRTACAIEDAGFEIRDQLAWVYGSGFPKSHDVSKGIDKAAGAARVETPAGKPLKRKIPGNNQNKDGWLKDDGREFVPTTSEPVTEDAKKWEGWGTALKPAWEPICLARKPLVGTVVGNVLAHGTGALNIGGCRIEAGADYSELDVLQGGNRLSGFGMSESQFKPAADGRWPANIVHDGSAEVLAGFPDSNGSGAERTLSRNAGQRDGDWGMNASAANAATLRDAGTGTAARFFYCAKADAADRHSGCYDLPKGKNPHPTVKPVDLMQWLIRMVTPPGGMVLDPFLGSGSTAIAADAERMDCIGIELSPEYAALAERRILGQGGMFASVTIEPATPPAGTDEQQPSGEGKQHGE